MRLTALHITSLAVLTDQRQRINVLKLVRRGFELTKLNAQFVSNFKYHGTGCLVQYRMIELYMAICVNNRNSEIFAIYARLPICGHWRKQTLSGNSENQRILESSLRPPKLESISNSISQETLKTNITFLETYYFRSIAYKLKSFILCIVLP